MYLIAVPLYDEDEIRKLNELRMMHRQRAERKHRMGIEDWALIAVWVACLACAIYMISRFK